MFARLTSYEAQLTGGVEAFQNGVHGREVVGVLRHVDADSFFRRPEGGEDRLGERPVQRSFRIKAKPSFIDPQPCHDGLLPGQQIRRINRIAETRSDLVFFFYPQSAWIDGDPVPPRIEQHVVVVKIAMKQSHVCL
jgi:hypothetical protein